MRENLEHWKAQDDFLAQVLSLFAASSPSASRHRVPIDEGIAELWEKSLAAKESHDLTIETADGLVTAHAHILKAASSVVIVRCVGAICAKLTSFSVWTAPWHEIPYHRKSKGWECHNGTV
jgi:hypothetical protein